MKNGWYKIIDMAINTDYWPDNDRIVYIENGIAIKYYNECWKRLDSWNVIYDPVLIKAIPLTQEEIDKLGLEEKMKDFDGVGIA